MIGRLSLFASVVTLAAVVYVATAAGHVTLVDSGELIVAAATLGVAHPPGFPLYTLLGRGFAGLPIGPVAYRLSAMSAVFGAVAAGFLALAAVELTGRQRRHHLCAGAAALGFACSATPWLYATVAEVYTLNLALVAAASWLLLRWRRRRGDGASGADRSLVLVGLLYGLGLGVHHVTVVLTLPAAGFLLWRTVGTAGLLRSRPLAVAAVVAASAAATLYLTLPLLAGRDQVVLAWGDPRTAAEFWWHITGKWYQTNLFSGAVLDNLESFARLAGGQAAVPLGPALAAVGLAVLWRRDRTGFGVLALLSAVGVGYAVQYEIAEDTDAYYLVTFASLALAAAAAAGWLSDRFPSRGGRAAVATVALAWPLSGVLGNYRSHDRSDYRVAPNLVEDAVAGIGPGGVLLTLDWQLYAPWLYLHHVEGYRSDVTVVDVNLVRRSWYVDRYLRVTYPAMMTACAAEADAFLARLRDWEHGRPHDPAELTARFTALLDAFLAYHEQRGRELHLTLPMEPGVGRRFAWIPDGLTMRLVAPPGPPPRPTPELRLEPLLDSPVADEVVDEKVRPYYARMHAERSRYLAARRRPASARRAMDTAHRLAPELIRHLGRPTRRAPPGSRRTPGPG